MALAHLLILLAQAPVAQAEAAPPTAAQRAQAMIEEERHLVTSRRHRADCPVDPLNNAIIVCAPDDTARYRLPPRDDSDPDPRSTRGKGLTPPDVSGAPNCTQVCIRGGYAPPPVYYLDTTTLPQAPPGSDADKIAKGEMRAP